MGREVARAESYLAITRSEDPDRLQLAVDLPADLRDIVFPPMVLLPLIDQAIGRRLEATQGRTLRISGDVRGSRLRLGVADSGAGFAEKIGEDNTASVRERLAALFGGQATLVLRAHEGGGTEAVMELPTGPRP